MKIHEYEAKKLFRKFKIPIPRGDVTTSPDSSLRVAEDLGVAIDGSRGYPIVRISSEGGVEVDELKRSNLAKEGELFV